MGREYDVPQIIRFADNRGNQSTLEGLSDDLNGRFIDWRKGEHGDLHPGDTLIGEIEIDPSFEAVEYRVWWHYFGGAEQRGVRAEILIENRHVGQQLELRFVVRTRRDWHKKNGNDDFLGLIYRVLPPI